jgi:hypothetical protein
VIVIAWFPARELVNQHEELSSENSQLSVLLARNSSLSADVAALSSNSTIAAIAHEQYGLVHPGQTSYVILPAAGSASSNGGLTTPSIAPQDLIEAPVGSSRTAPSATATSGTGGFWSRFSNHLEFWRWAF